MENLQPGVIAITFGVIIIATLLIYRLFKRGRLKRGPSNEANVIDYNIHSHHLPEKNQSGDGVASPDIEGEIEEPAEQIQENQMPATPEACHSYHKDPPPTYDEAIGTRSSPQFTVKPESDSEFVQSPGLTENERKFQAKSCPQLRLEPQNNETFVQAFGLTETIPQIVATGIVATQEDTPIRVSKSDQAASDEQQASQNSIKFFVAEETAGERSQQTSIKSIHEEDEPQMMYVDVPQYECSSPTETFTFDVDKKGCRVDTPYCKLYFPPGATKHSSRVRMTPIYEKNVCELASNAITPTVDFDSDEELTFDKDIEIAFHTSYAAISGYITVKVIWRKDRSGEFSVLKDDVLFRERHFVRFSTKHFCQLCVVADESQFKNMQRLLYSVMYCRKPRSNRKRFVHWLLYDDCPDISFKQQAYLRDKEVLVDPELFELKYGFNLQLKLNGDSGVCIKDNNLEIPFVSKWTTPFCRTFQFNISRNNERTSEENMVRYEILAVHHQNWTIISIQESRFYLEWQQETPNVMVGNQYNVSVTGDSAIGIQTNTDGTGQGLVQPQTSDVSNASSGYSSQLNSPSTDRPFPEFRSSEQVVEEISSAENVPVDQMNDPDTSQTHMIPDTRPKSQRDESEIPSRHSPVIPSSLNSKEPVNQETSDKVFES